MVPRSDCARSADASCTAFQEIDAHKTPLSSRMISESGFPDAWPSLSASACRSSSDILGASERPWGGVRRPASTNLRTAASSSLSVSSGEPDASSGAIWMRTLEFSCKSNGCKGRRSPSLYTAVTVIASVIIHLNSLGRCTPFLWYAIFMVRHSYGATCALYTPLLYHKKGHPTESTCGTVSARWGLTEPSGVARAAKSSYTLGRYI